jgi:predicted GNAT family N-acyltransferase
MVNNLDSSSQLVSSIFSGVPSAAQTLIWEVFFASRQRGIDLRTHFPWIETNVGTYCLALSETNGGPVVATLVLRKHNLLSVSRWAKVGMVCVDQAWRGRGLGKQLLNNILTFAAEQKIMSLVLWTGQPSIYKGHGFASDSCDTFGQVTLHHLYKREPVRFSERHGSSNRGLPPFAQQLIHFESATAELIGLETSNGMSLAEWRGPLPKVLDLIESAFPTTWSLNAPAEAPIFEEIRNRGHLYTSLPGAKRMVRHLGIPAQIPYISVLDRI